MWMTSQNKPVITFPFNAFHIIEEPLLENLIHHFYPKDQWLIKWVSSKWKSKTSTVEVPKSDSYPGILSEDWNRILGAITFNSSKLSKLKLSVQNKI